MTANASTAPLPRLERWHTFSPEDAYTPPELRTLMVVGNVYGHATRQDGILTRTSSIVKAEGRQVTTFSGSVYVLGEPHPDFLAYLAANNLKWDPENPIKVHGAAP